jgi:hypothetical protein
VEYMMHDETDAGEHIRGYVTVELLAGGIVPCVMDEKVGVVL